MTSTLRETLARAAEHSRRVLDTSGRCAYAERLVTGCCERHYRCHHPDRMGGIYEPGECSCACTGFLLKDSTVAAADRDGSSRGAAAHKA